MVAMKKSDEQDARARAMIDAGIPLRSAALSHGDDCVHVLFRTDHENDKCVGYYMSRDAYRAIPLMEIATPDDFRKFGYLVKAPGHFE